METDVCRGCGSGSLYPVLSLGEQPPANALTDVPHPPGESRYPLDLLLCETCGLVQLSVSVPPEVLFRDYAYFSRYSPVLVDNAADIVHRVIDEKGLGSDDLAMEIGSNDGYLLQHYSRRGVRVLGIEPAENVAEVAVDNGVATRSAFFGRELARELAAEGVRPAVIHANNVMAHVPDINGVLEGMRHVLADDGVVIIETPYVRDLVEQVEFDTIYHEHLFYYSVTALDPLLRRNGLRLDAVEHLPIHGGSLRVFAVKDDGRGPGDSARRYLQDETAAGLRTRDYFASFGERVQGLRVELAQLLHRLREEGATVGGYGAAAKATVLLNAVGADTTTVAFVADQSPHKQGRYVPGVGIPIVAPGALLDHAPDYVLVLAWNLADEIMAQQAEYRERGGQFIIPLPAPTIVAASGQGVSKHPSS